nr:MAG TPA: hypothetical protein [Caudoviricetes sp.]
MHADNFMIPILSSEVVVRSALASNFNYNVITMKYRCIKFCI